jgi:hypothetical protein
MVFTALARFKNEICKIKQFSFIDVKIPHHFLLKEQVLKPDEPCLPGAITSVFAYLLTSKMPRRH